METIPVKSEAGQQSPYPRYVLSAAQKPVRAILAERRANPGASAASFTEASLPDPKPNMVGNGSHRRRESDGRNGGKSS